MVVMNVKLDNLLCFNNFSINFSYPKKIVNSPLDCENLTGYPNFRYKRINILMGSNATGKTAFGKVLESIFRFVGSYPAYALEDLISDASAQASFELDCAVNGLLIRLRGTSNGFRTCNLTAKIVPIGKRDSYKSCIEKFNQMQFSNVTDEISRLFGSCGLLFTSVLTPDVTISSFDSEQRNLLLKVLRNVVRTMDPSIEDIVESKDLADSYIIKRGRDEIIIQNGKLLARDKLSTGTADGVSIALALAMLMLHKYGLYYIDEKFSFVQSDIEKRILSLMIYNLQKDSQLFFTSHNTDILEMSLPRHSYTFLRRSKDEKHAIDSISASEIIKNNRLSLRSAVENDVFESLPDDTLLDDLG